VGLCDKYSISGDLLNCANWLPENQTKLDYSAYTSRDTRYEATDYSGMSLYNRYPVDNLHLLDISINSAKSGPDTLKPDFRLVKFVDCITATGSCGSDTNGPTNDQYGKLLCGLGDIGKVFSHNGSSVCAVGIDGSRFDSVSPYVVKVSTRAYAEQDGPFPQSVATGSQSGSRKVTFGFQQANICDSTVASCESGYYKMQYGSTSGVRYYSIDGPLGGTEVPTCICDGGALDGIACNRFDPNDKQTSSIDQQCPGGSPIQLRRSDVYLNWPGYCLEPDTSTHINASATQFACLSWLPVDIAPGGTDYFNQNREAGYSYKAPAYYCLQTDVVEERHDFKLNDCMTTNQTSERLEYADVNGGRTGQKWNGKFVHGDYVVGINQSVSCNRGWNVSDQAYWHFYPIAREGSKEYCLNNPEIIGYFDHDTRGRLYYTNYCVAPYNGDTLRLVNTQDGDSGQFIDTIESAPVAQCSYLAKAVDAQGNNAAVTNLFWSEYKLPNGLEYTINIGSGNGYKLGSSDTPFGSAIPSSGLEPKDFPRLDMKSVGQVPNAGSPYACSNDDSICGLLAQKGSDAFISTWTDPGFAGDENYTDGMIRLRTIYKRVFGIYHYISGSVCNFNVCDSGLRGGQNCQGVGGSSCVLSDLNHCNAFSNCINSPWGQNRPCTIQCAPGFSANPAGNCEQDFNSQIGCAIACTTYINNMSSTNDVDKAIAGTGDCSQTSSPYTCAYTPASDTASGKARCQATGSTITCEPNGVRSFCRVNGAFTKVECASAIQCQTLLQAANEATFCAPPAAHYCSGPDFDDDISKNWLKETVNCATDFTNGLGQTLLGYNTTTGETGDGICQATGAQCKLASKVTVDKGSGPVPYCDEKADSYQPLCNPDDDPVGCPYNSPNTIYDAANKFIVHDKIISGKLIVKKK
jgi:hypothetical protein